MTLIFSLHRQRESMSVNDTVSNLKSLNFTWELILLFHTLSSLFITVVICIWIFLVKVPPHDKLSYAHTTTYKQSLSFQKSCTNNKCIPSWRWFPEICSKYWCTTFCLIHLYKIFLNSILPHCLPNAHWQVENLVLIKALLVHCQKVQQTSSFYIKLHCVTILNGFI